MVVMELKGRQPCDFGYGGKLKRMQDGQLGAVRLWLHHLGSNYDDSSQDKISSSNLAKA